MNAIGYILPTNLSHEGILRKVQGQLTSLQKRTSPYLCFIDYSNSDSLIQKLLAYIVFELKSLFFLIRYPVIYIRYNPKSILLNCLTLFFSWLKPLYIEHNTLYSPELRFLNRKNELLLHKLTYFLYRFSNCIHIGVNKELSDHLSECGLNRVIYAQNGYLAPHESLDESEVPLLNKVKEFQKKFKYCAIFCGNGYIWHGVDDVIAHLKHFPDIGLIVAGPFKLDPSPNILQINFMQSPTWQK